MNWLANVFTFSESTWLSVIGFLAVVLLLSLVVPYFVLRREEESKLDTQLGLKIVLHFFFSVCVLVMLLGLTILVRGLLEAYLWGGTPPTIDLGIYLGIAGALLTGMYYCSLQFGTNDRLFPAAGRLYDIWRFAFHSVIILLAVALTAVTLSEPMPTRRPVYYEYLSRQWLCFATLIIWGPSWLLHLWWVWKHSVAATRAVKQLSWDTSETK
jgi:hypothetical protein